MSVGLLIITHGGIGTSLLAAATRMLGRCPLEADTLSVTEENERDQLQARVAVGGAAAVAVAGDISGEHGVGHDLAPDRRLPGAGCGELVSFPLLQALAGLDDLGLGDPLDRGPA